MNLLSREKADEMNNSVDFTDEEGYGKYFDLHECYAKYINLKGIQKVDYVTYLTIFDCLLDIPQDKKNYDYRSYLQSLVDYLVDYVAGAYLAICSGGLQGPEWTKKPNFQRKCPFDLVLIGNIDSLLHIIEQDFEK